MIGFIGLGNMGMNMARNIMAKGHKIIVYDVLPAAMDKLKAEGAQTANSPAQVASVANRIISIVPTDSHVLDVYAGPKGVFETAKPQTLCMDSSTISPGTPQKLYEVGKLKKIDFLDTPVAGAVPAAKSGTLTFMVGGDKSAFEKARPTLQLMGKNIVHCGAVGNGQMVKICNNMLLAINMLGTSETLNMGKRLGLDVKMLSDIINTGSGRSWTTEIYNPAPGIMPDSPASRNYEGNGFPAKHMTKDLGLAQNLATLSHSPTPLGSMVHQLYRIMIQSPEFETKDFSVIFKFLSEKLR